jgi:hypothetical protein
MSCRRSRRSSAQRVIARSRTGWTLTLVAAKSSMKLWLVAELCARRHPPSTRQTRVFIAHIYHHQQTRMALTHHILHVLSPPPRLNKHPFHMPHSSLILPCVTSSAPHSAVHRAVHQHAYVLVHARIQCRTRPFMGHRWPHALYILNYSTPGIWRSCIRITSHPRLSQFFLVPVTVLLHACYISFTHTRFLHTQRHTTPTSFCSSVPPALPTDKCEVFRFLRSSFDYVLAPPQPCQALSETHANRLDLLLCLAIQCINLAISLAQFARVLRTRNDVGPRRAVRAYEERHVIAPLLCHKSSSLVHMSRIPFLSTYMYSEMLHVLKWTHR